MCHLWENISNGEESSFLAYLCSISENQLSFKDVELLISLLPSVLQKLYTSETTLLSEILNLIDSSGKSSFVLKTETGCFTFHIKDKWFFNLIILSSVCNLTFIFKTLDHQQSIMRLILCLLKNTDPNKLLSVHLIKSLEHILKKRIDVVNELNACVLLKEFQKLSSSQFALIKHCAQNVIKRLVKLLSIEELECLKNLDLYPIQGLDSSVSVDIIHTKQIKTELIANKVKRLFSNNVYSRDGAFLYQSLVKCSFKDWTLCVYPFFKNNLINVEQECEFFQSLLKYWIPINVKRYKEDFYIFLKHEPIDYDLKAYILLETKQRGHNLPLNETIPFIKCINTSSLGLRLLNIDIKKEQALKDIHFNCILHYLYNGNDDNLTLKSIFAYLFLNAHSILKQKGKVDGFSMFLVHIYNFCYNIIENEPETASSLLKIVWECATFSSKDLNSNKMLRDNDQYASYENMFYLHLRSTGKWLFEDEHFVRKLEMCNNKLGEYCCLNRIITEYYKSQISVNSMKVLSEMSRTVCLQNIHQIANYSYTQYEMQDIISKLINNLNVVEFNETLLFECVLFMEILTRVAGNENSFLKDDLVVMCLKKIENLLDEKQYISKGPRCIKLVEAFINNTLTLINVINVDFMKVIGSLKMVIEISNMRKPVTYAAEVIRKILCQKDYDVKCRFLDEILKTLLNDESLNLMIRKNPETRLLIHAVCGSDLNTDKPLLKWSLECLVAILDSDVSDSSMISTFNCLELLLSDKSFHNFTLEYVPKIIQQTFRHFGRASWAKRNAILQLTKTIIERFYGVSLNNCNRPKMCMEFFQLFPETATLFYKELLKDSRPLLLSFQFFAESQLKRQPYYSNFFLICHETFYQLFTYIIQTDWNSNGVCAVKSLVALCFESDIPVIFGEIVDFLTKSKQLSKNILRNMLEFLKELYEKYMKSFDAFCNKNKAKIIEKRVEELVYFLRQINSTFCDLRLIKINSVDEVLNKIGTVSTEQFIDRTWLHNNVPFALYQSKSSNLGLTVSKILASRPPCFIEVKMLSILVEQRTEIDLNLLNILIARSTQIDDDNIYLLNCYFNTIFLFIAHLEMHFPLSFECETCYSTENIHKMLIIIFILSNKSNKTTNDYKFVENVIENVIEMMQLNNSLAYDISVSLPYLFKCVDKNICKSRIIKIAFYLLLLPETSTEMCKFVMEVCKVPVYSLLDAFNKLLSHSALMYFFKNDVSLVRKTLQELDFYLHNISEDFQDSAETFYLIKNEISVPKDLLKRIILKNLKLCKNDNICT